jgi:predicted dehydrogenase
MPDKNNRIKIGLAGVGHLGKIHLKCIQGIPDLQLTGIYDKQSDIAKQVSGEFNVTMFETYQQLLESCDAVDIVATTSAHFELAKDAITKNKHCFIEKPVSSTLEEAIQLQKLAIQHQVCVQIGHVERFNPSFAAIRSYIKNPKFIEAHRLSSFNPRGRDVSVIHDIMIHDLDLICLLAKSTLKEVKASGVSLVSPFPDLCHSRLEF